MDDKIRHELSIKKVREMRNPKILMNSEDFTAFKIELESKVTNFKVGDKPTYEGIPIVVRDYVDKGTIIVFDDISWMLKSNA